MRIAVLADIHGNLHALEAVAREVDRLGADHVIVDGDLINALPFSPEVIDFVRRRNWTVVRGNHEFYYLDFGTERALAGMDDPDRWGQLHWMVERISPEQGDYLAVLPDERTLFFNGVEPIRVAHGVPGRNRVGFYNEQPEPSIVAEIENVQERTVISAHTHVQVDRHVSMPRSAESDLFADPHKSARRRRERWNLNGDERHWHVINPGSVGLPLNGDPRAQFAVIESVPEADVPGGWRATHFNIPYDRRPALEAFTSTGMLEAGGTITELFYWELVTAEPEIISFYEWARANGYEPSEDIDGAFAAYASGSGRGKYVRSRDPLFGGS